MKTYIITTLLIASAYFMNAQTSAITGNGDEVILYEDGTWKYLDDSAIEKTVIPVNKKKFSKDKNSSFLVKSNRLNVGIYINPKSWSFTKGGDEEVYEFQFQKKGGDLYAMLISEKIQVPIETLKEVAITNARSAAPDIKVVKEEYRTVNGIQVLMMQMTGTIQGIEFTYYGYYYSNSKGTIQLLTYTSETLFNEYKGDIELFLNGFVEQ